MRQYLYSLATDKYRGFIPGLIKVFLWLLSLIYGLIVRILIFIARLNLERLPCKVISVGNISLGGTGKTTLVAFIAQYLQEKGHKVAILSRGYKKGDEPHMLLQKLKDIPVIVDKDRIRAAHTAVRDYAVDTVILDDGFQQWKIIKDLEIVAIDASRPFTNKYLLPRGILREPILALQRADIFVLTKVDLSQNPKEIRDFLSQINPQAEIFESIHRPAYFYEIGKPQEKLRPDALQGKSAILFSGIGDPDSFESLVKALGIKISLSFRFPDHHDYSPADLSRIMSSGRDKDGNIIITTDKDAARLKESTIKDTQLKILVLGIELLFTKDEERFSHRLLRVYSN